MNSVRIIGVKSGFVMCKLKKRSIKQTDRPLNYKRIYRLTSEIISAFWYDRWIRTPTFCLQH